MNSLDETVKNATAIMSLVWSVGKMQKWVRDIKRMTWWFPPPFSSHDTRHSSPSSQQPSGGCLRLIFLFDFSSFRSR